MVKGFIRRLRPAVVLVGVLIMSSNGPVAFASTTGVSRSPLNSTPPCEGANLAKASWSGGTYTFRVTMSGSYVYANTHVSGSSIMDYFAGTNHVETQGGVNASPGSGADTGNRSFSASNGQGVFIEIELTNPANTVTYCQYEWQRTA
jgi:hypothetical protein